MYNSLATVLMVESVESPEAVVREDLLEAVVSEDPSDAVVTDDSLEAVVCKDPFEAVVSEDPLEAVVREDLLEAVVTEVTPATVLREETVVDLAGDDSFSSVVGFVVSISAKSVVVPALSEVVFAVDHVSILNHFQVVFAGASVGSGEPRSVYTGGRGSLGVVNEVGTSVALDGFSNSSSCFGELSGDVDFTGFTGSSALLEDSVDCWRSVTSSWFVAWLVVVVGVEEADSSSSPNRTTSK